MPKRRSLAAEVARAFSYGMTPGQYSTEMRSFHRWLSPDDPPRTMDDPDPFLTRPELERVRDAWLARAALDYKEGHHAPKN